LTVLLTQRRTQRFRGQIFFLFVFGYGYLRFMLETLRDDAERGEYGPVMPEHILIPGALLLMSLGFVFGISLGITNKSTRLAARIASFVPPVVAYVMLRPQTFGASISLQLSTSQWIGFLTALAVSLFYAQYSDAARKLPKVAMSAETLGPGAALELAKEAGDAVQAAREDEDDEEESDSPEDEAALTVTKAEAPRPKKRERIGGDEEEADGDSSGKTAPQG
jgi:phosphatidylglycerol:prolipoprotein diacylglycerol transferase